MKATIQFSIYSILLILFSVRTVENVAPYILNMYKTEKHTLEREDHHCIHYHTIDHILNSHLPLYYLYTYCLRDNDSDVNDFSRTLETDKLATNFSELYKRGITSYQLFLWSAPMDIVEDYQIYSTNGSSVASRLATKRFYNCSWPHFGSFCQFSFEISHTSFDDLIQKILSYPSYDEDQLQRPLSCYTQISCKYIYPMPLCLDWREICDGKVHCLNGAQDERHCFELEMNECANEDEYRCHNGAQCIPRVFWHDDSLHPDCLDRSDETWDYSSYCYSDPFIPCEEHTCRADRHVFTLACGDGSCDTSHDCFNGRSEQLDIILYGKANQSPFNEICWKLISCLTRIYHLEEYECECALLNRCEVLIQENCPSLFIYPSYSIALGHIVFVYSNIQLYFNRRHNTLLPTYVCYNVKLCSDFETSTGFLRSIKIPINNKTLLYCHNQLDLPLSDEARNHTWHYFQLAVHKFYSSSCFAYGQLYMNLTEDCKSYSQLYQCAYSKKCISKHRLLDGIQDCPFGDDEEYRQSCSLSHHKYRFQCIHNQTMKCISPILFNHKDYNCLTLINKEYASSDHSKFNAMSPISFQTLCDGFQDREPLLLNGEHLETDETHCDKNIWPCNNTYTHCDGYWNCMDGLDEAGCYPIFSYISNTPLCNPDEHICTSARGFNPMCLNLSRVNDGIIDCLGGFDERIHCRNQHGNDSIRRFTCSDEKIKHCLNIDVLCDDSQDCDNNEDESICRYLYEMGKFPDYVQLRPKFLCLDSMKTKRPYLLDSLCKLDETEKPKIVHFSLNDFLNHPHVSEVNRNRLNSRVKRDSPIFPLYQRRCNRGISVQIRRRSSEKHDYKCLCPPSYYGSRCEYQSERISLTIQLRPEMEWRTLFHIAILLIDSEYIVQSYQQFNYLPIRDCGTKFNTYLLYKSRSKNRTNQYSIRIDAFVTETLEYRASWLYPVEFNFLPVHRIAVQIAIPLTSFINNHSSTCTTHGITTRYVNTNQTFCYCKTGWRGSHCDIKYECNCSPDSICLGSSTSCLCPMHKFGTRCYLKHIVCHENSSFSCLNGGSCVPSEVWFVDYAARFLCACPEGYSGDRCQYNDSRIEITFSEEFRPLPTTISAHLITVSGNASHKHVPILSKILFDQTIVVFRTPIEFHLIFIEFKSEYYLIYLQPIYQRARIIQNKMISSQRCLHIRELFDPIIVDYHPLLRAKFYHKACQEQLKLRCFHDSDTFMCLCNPDRKANCFNFNYHIIHNCSGNNYCKNGAKCFLDSPTCPTTSMCACQDCFYGSRCQLSTKGFNPSLDVILTYHIESQISFLHQSVVVKISFTLMILLSTTGLISASFAIITFRTKSLQTGGCVLYLLTTSVVSLFTMFVFVFKFLLLFSIQYKLIVHSWIITSNCILMDYLLRVSLNIGDWLNACVALERCYMIKTGVMVSTKQNRQIAKVIIPFVILATFLTGIHDPLHRKLFYDIEDGRTWCIADYDSKPFIQYFDSFMVFFHFILPFIIQAVLSLFIVILRAYTRSVLHKQRFCKHFNKILNQYYHLLIAPWLLVLLASPRFVIYFYAGCMKSATEPWLALSGYFISFVPPVLIFPIFVLPSKVFVKVWKENLKNYWTILRCR